jgi:hypothetical protein
MKSSQLSDNAKLSKPKAVKIADKAIKYATI